MDPKGWRDPSKVTKAVLRSKVTSYTLEEGGTWVCVTSDDPSMTMEEAIDAISRTQRYAAIRNADGVVYDKVLADCLA